MAESFASPELLAGTLRLAEAVLESLNIHFDEAGSFYYEEILLKRSVTGDSNSGPCDYCDDNEAEGWIDSEAVYPSGHDGPPFHENCVCSEEYKTSRRRVYD